MCHHWVADREAEWERVAEELAEEDPELEAAGEPEADEEEPVEVPAADD